MMPGGRAQRPREPESTEDGAALALFGVVPAPTPSHARGLDDPTVRFVARDEVAAAVRPAPAVRGRPGRTELLDHHAVLDALAARGPVVPVRFGTVLPGRDALVELLAELHDQLAATLRHLAGRRQFNLRASYVEESVLRDLVMTQPEVAALRQRTKDLPEAASYADRMRLGELVAGAVEVRAAADAQALLDDLAPLVSSLRLRSESSGMQVLDVAILVEDARTTALLDRLETLAAQNHEDLRLRLVGPMAAYDFAGDLAWA